MCKKRKRRIFFLNEIFQYLIYIFEQNLKFISVEINELFIKLGFEFVIVRVWFCNRKQMMKRMVFGKSRLNISLKVEFDVKKQEDLSEEKELVKLDFINMLVGQFLFIEDRVKVFVCLTLEVSLVKSLRFVVVIVVISFVQVYDDSIVYLVF